MPRAEVVEAGFLVEAAGLEDVVVVDTRIWRLDIVQRVPQAVGAGTGVNSRLAVRRAFVALDDLAGGIGHVRYRAEGVGVEIIFEIFGRDVPIHVVDVLDLEHQGLVDLVAIDCAAEQSLGLALLVLRDFLPAIRNDAQGPIHASLRVPVGPLGPAAYRVCFVRAKHETVRCPDNGNQIVPVVISVQVRPVRPQVPVGVVGPGNTAHGRVRVDRVGRVGRGHAIRGHGNAVVNAVDGVGAAFRRDHRDRIRLEPRSDRAAKAVQVDFREVVRKVVPGLFDALVAVVVGVRKIGDHEACPTIPALGPDPAEPVKTGIHVRAVGHVDLRGAQAGARKQETRLLQAVDGRSRPPLVCIDTVTGQPRPVVDLRDVRAGVEGPGHVPRQPAGENLIVVVAVV